MLYIALLLLAFVQVVLGVVLSYKKHSTVSRAFIYFTFALFIWTLANTTLAYSVNATNFGSLEFRTDVLNWSNRIGFASGTVTLAALYRLVLVFPLARKKTKLSAITIWLGVLVGVVALHPVVAGQYELAELNATPKYLYGAFSNGVTAYYLLVVIETIRSMISAMRSTTDKIIKSQIRTILFGLTATATLAIVIIVVLPPITGSDHYIIFGYFTPYIFATAVFYSIFRQGFLNFQAIVARSVGYVLTIGAMVGGYLLTVVLVLRVLAGENVNWLEAGALSVLSVVTALLFRPLKKQFDKVTNRVFYRDAYDAQDLLNELNETLISSIDLEKLLSKTATVLEKHLKSEFCSFAILDSKDEKSLRFINGPTVRLQHYVTNSLDNYMAKNTVRFVQTDQIQKGGEELRQNLQEARVGAIIKITKDTHQQGVGYLLLGSKKSGNPYNAQDLRLVEIVANESLIAIQNALRFEEIQSFAKTLQAKVDEATKDLRTANEKLKKMDQTKDDFISMASHQLRTPLTSVKGYVSMVLEGDTGKISAQQRKLLDQAFISSQRMVYLIADLLNVSRLRTGKFIVEAKPTNLAEVVEGEIGQLIETAKGRELKLSYHKPKSFPELMLDETKIRQVIMNFVDNAIYYTPAGGTVTVALEDKGESIDFTVTDTGIGVPKAEQHHLFTKFYRAGNAKKARPDGTGLGLFMAKKVVVAQGGAIIFKTSEGKGSTFGFSFAKSRLTPQDYKAPAPDIEE